MLKADLHIHTRFSPDCLVSPEQLIAQCLKVGINCVAITDHGTIAGALGVQEISPFRVIVGEEVFTTSGEIMGLFLTEEIPNGLSPHETISRIKAQGGLVNIPHPFDLIRRALKSRYIEELLPQIDLVEVFNARASVLGNSSKAELLARRNHLLGTAGSDAHTLKEIGSAYVEMPEFRGKEEFLSALAQGKIYGRRASIWVHWHSNLTRLRRMLWK